MDKKYFIDKAILKYGNKYDFSKLPEVFNGKDKVTITCPVHGDFIKDYDHFIRRGQECPLCSKRNRYTTESFIRKCQSLPHTSDYSFEKTEFVSTGEKVTVNCHHKDSDGNEHGYFQITPAHLLSGEGCPKCRYIKSAEGRRRNIDEVKKIATEVHNGKYDYSLITEYKNDRIKYPIICPVHGVFYQTFNNHNKGQGCPECGREQFSISKTLTTDEFIKKSKIIHGEKYDYSDSVYTKGMDYIIVKCPVHGEFKQIARNHLFGEGCSKCAREKSNVERELFNFVSSCLPNEEIIENDRSVLNGKEIDVYVPSLKIGFEMNGLIWHSEKFNNSKYYHINKTKDACEKGVRLIQIFEDEWTDKQEICKSRIRNALGLSSNKIYARKCVIQEISQSDAKLFIAENHIQGWAPAKIRLGAFYEGNLVSVMTFGKPRINVRGNNMPGNYELIRFCNVLNTNVMGIAGKFLKYFEENYKPDEIISYADLRWSNGSVYEKIGFSKVSETNPSYSYVIGKKRVNRFSMRKNLLIEKYGCPVDMTEREFCESNGWYRLYDCGCAKYILNYKTKKL